MQRILMALGVGVFAASAARAQSIPADVRQRDRALAQVIQKVRENPRQARDDSLAWLFEREAVLRLLSILSGTPPAGDKKSGWLVPSRTRYTASWLLQQYDRDGDGAVSAEEWPGPKEWFQKLDRDRDGSITVRDLDWSPDSPLAKASNSAKMLFREIDVDGDGRISSEEWIDHMHKLSQGRAYLTQDDLLPLFAATPPKRSKGGAGRGAGGINVALLKAFFEGDVASMFEGPRPGAPAPDFTLKTPDGKSTLTLSKHFGKKPIVLVFGSFT